MEFLKNIRVLLLVLVLFSCAEEEETFINSTNQLYTYHAPQMTNRAVFVYDYSKDTLGRLTKDLGTFNLSLEQVADTLNYMIRQSFTADMIYSYLLESSEIEISLARLKIIDTLDIKKDSIIFLGKDRIPRMDQGNEILPGLYLDNFNREILACNDFFRIVGRDTTSNDTLNFYVQQTCTVLRDDEAVKAFIFSIPNIIVDTISIEQVNYIYTSY